MKYITSVTFPRNNTLIAYLNGGSSDDWPYNVFLDRGLENIVFDDITILYGNNGSGKSTLLNTICEKVHGVRNKPIFKDKKYKPGAGVYCPFEDYVESLNYKTGTDCETGFPLRLPNNIKLITSDDIFTKINNTIRNNTISTDEQDAAIDEYEEERYSHMQLGSLADYDKFVKHNKIKKTSKLQYINENSRRRLELHSNGETAIEYFDSVLEPDGLYFLDEPENCLSPVFQIELIKIIIKAKRFLNCQFIIATHSPLILSLPDAKVYDLDSTPIIDKPWNELDNVKIYFDFFYKNKDKFLR